MPDVLILVGSESDKPRIEPAFEILTKAGFSYEFYASSAHRQPEQTGDLVFGHAGADIATSALHRGGGAAAAFAVAGDLGVGE